MRRAAWWKQGIVVIRPADVRDDWTRQALVNEATRLYGRREVACGETDAGGHSSSSMSGYCSGDAPALATIFG